MSLKVDTNIYHVEGTGVLYINLNTNEGYKTLAYYKTNPTSFAILKSPPSSFSGVKINITTEEFFNALLTAIKNT